MSDLQIVYYANDPTQSPPVVDPNGLWWRAVSTCENGNNSVVVDREWLRWRAMWGPSTFLIVAWNDHAPHGEPDYTRDFWELPPGSRLVTAEGKREHPGVVVTVTHLRKMRW